MKPRDRLTERHPRYGNIGRNGPHIVLKNKRPGFDVASLLHEGTHSEPETVEDGEVTGNGRPVTMILDVPLERTEPAHKEQHHADAEV